MVRPKSLRLSKVGTLLTLGTGPHELHPVELQVPHPLLLSTFKEVVIVLALLKHSRPRFQAALTLAASNGHLRSQERSKNGLGLSVLQTHLCFEQQCPYVTQ